MIRKTDSQIAMFPTYSASDMRFDMFERELHVDNIKTNECRIGPPARGVNSPHANLHDSFRWTPWKYVSTTYPTTEVQHALGRVVGRDHHRRPAVEEVSP